MWYMGLNKNNVPIGWTQENPPEWYIQVSDDVRTIHELHPDYIWDGITLVESPQPEPPDPVVPSVVTMRQARLQLSVLGAYQTVNAAVATMGETAQIEWEYATTVERTNPLAQAMIALLQWSEQEADDYFTAAAQL